MAKIILTDEQRDELLRTGSVIELYCSDGRRLGTTYVSGPEPTLEELQAMSARVTSWVPAEEVNARLRSLTKCE